MLQRVGCLVVIFAVCAPFVWAEKFYSYSDRNGFLVFSNHRPRQGEKYDVKEMEIERDRPDLLQFDESRYNQYDDLIQKFCEENGVEFNLVKALILVESNFNPKARSPKGAMGLMQLMPDTARRYDVSYPYDPEDNIRGGVSYLRDLIVMFDGDVQLILAAYNAGENLVKKIRRVPSYKETVQYVATILKIYGKAQTRVSDDLVVYTPGSRFFRYYDENGTLTFTNIDPPANAKPAK
jgi:hypothetical protein